MKRVGDPWPLAATLAVALAWYGGAAWLGRGEPVRAGQERAAAQAMTRALACLARAAAERGCQPDPGTDPNHTGLVGLPFSPLTTTLGSLPAKRTGAQPEAASLLARLLLQAGVQPGDQVALDSSGSFPGFAVAALVAARALGAQTLAVTSIGASSYGANRPGFTLPDMLDVLVRNGLLAREPAAVSAGGDADLGRNMDPDALAAALGRARARGCRILRVPDLGQDVAAKLAVIGHPRVLVSVGGNWASAGPGEALLGRTGLLRPGDFGPAGPAGTGLIQACLRQGIPVIRILDVQDLCARSGLPFDPVPWSGKALARPVRGRRLLGLAGPVLALLAGGWVRWLRIRATRPGRPRIPGQMR